MLAGFDPAAMDLLRRYAFPGNVRELSNIVERAAVLSRSPTIKPEDLPPNLLGVNVSVPCAPRPMPLPGGPDTIGAGAGEPGALPSLEDALKDPERRIIIGALRAANWNRLRAAEALRINRTTLYKKMKLHHIEAHDAA